MLSLFLVAKRRLFSHALDEHRADWEPCDSLTIHPYRPNESPDLRLVDNRILRSFLLTWLNAFGTSAATGLQLTRVAPFPISRHAGPVDSSCETPQSVVGAPVYARCGLSPGSAAFIGALSATNSMTAANHNNSIHTSVLNHVSAISAAAAAALNGAVLGSVPGSFVTNITSSDEYFSDTAAGVESGVHSSGSYGVSSSNGISSGSGSDTPLSGFHGARSGSASFLLAPREALLRVWRQCVFPLSFMLHKERARSIALQQHVDSLLDIDAQQQLLQQQRGQQTSQQRNHGGGNVTSTQCPIARAKAANELSPMVPLPLSNGSAEASTKNTHNNHKTNMIHNVGKFHLRPSPPTALLPPPLLAPASPSCSSVLATPLVVTQRRRPGRHLRAPTQVAVTVATPLGTETTETPQSRAATETHAAEVRQREERVTNARARVRVSAGLHENYNTTANASSVKTLLADCETYAADCERKVSVCTSVTHLTALDFKGEKEYVGKLTTTALIARNLLPALPGQTPRIINVASSNDVNNKYTAAVLNSSNEFNISDDSSVCVDGAAIEATPLAFAVTGYKDKSVSPASDAETMLSAATEATPRAYKLTSVQAPTPATVAPHRRTLTCLDVASLMLVANNINDHCDGNIKTDANTAKVEPTAHKCSEDPVISSSARTLTANPVSASSSCQHVPRLPARRLSAASSTVDTIADVTAPSTNRAAAGLHTPGSLLCTVSDAPSNCVNEVYVNSNAAVTDIHGSATPANARVKAENSAGRDGMSGSLAPLTLARQGSLPARPPTVPLPALPTDTTQLRPALLHHTQPKSQIQLQPQSQLVQSAIRIVEYDGAALVTEARLRSAVAAQRALAPVTINLAGSDLAAANAAFEEEGKVALASRLQRAHFNSKQASTGDTGEVDHSKKCGDSEHSTGCENDGSEARDNSYLHQYLLSVAVATEEKRESATLLPYTTALQNLSSHSGDVHAANAPISEYLARRISQAAAGATFTGNMSSAGTESKQSLKLMHVCANSRASSTDAAPVTRPKCDLPPLPMPTVLAFSSSGKQRHRHSYSHSYSNSSNNALQTSIVIPSAAENISRSLLARRIDNNHSHSQNTSPASVSSDSSVVNNNRDSCRIVAANECLPVTNSNEVLPNSSSRETRRRGTLTRKLFKHQLLYHGGLQAYCHESDDENNTQGDFEEPPSSASPVVAAAVADADASAATISAGAHSFDTSFVDLFNTTRTSNHNTLSDRNNRALSSAAIAFVPTVATSATVVPSGAITLSPKSVAASSTWEQEIFVRVRPGCYLAVRSGGAYDMPASNTSTNINGDHVEDTNVSDTTFPSTLLINDSARSEQPQDAELAGTSVSQSAVQAGSVIAQSLRSELTAGDVSDAWEKAKKACNYNSNGSGSLPSTPSVEPLSESDCGNNMSSDNEDKRSNGNSGLLITDDSSALARTTAADTNAVASEKSVSCNDSDDENKSCVNNYVLKHGLDSTTSGISSKFSSFCDTSEGSSNNVTALLQTFTSAMLNTLLPAPGGDSSGSDNDSPQQSPTVSVNSRRHNDRQATVAESVSKSGMTSLDLNLGSSDITNAQSINEASFSNSHRPSSIPAGAVAVLSDCVRTVTTAISLELVGDSTDQSRSSATAHTSNNTGTNVHEPQCVFGLALRTDILRAHTITSSSADSASHCTTQTPPAPVASVDADHRHTTIPLSLSVTPPVAAFTLHEQQPEHKQEQEPAVDMSQTQQTSVYDGDTNNNAFPAEPWRVLALANVLSPPANAAVTAAATATLVQHRQQRLQQQQHHGGDSSDGTSDGVLFGSSDNSSVAGDGDDKRARNRHSVWCEYNANNSASVTYDNNDKCVNPDCAAYHDNGGDYEDYDSLHTSDEFDAPDTAELNLTPGGGQGPGRLYPDAFRTTFAPVATPDMRAVATTYNGGEDSPALNTKTTSEFHNKTLLSASGVAFVEAKKAENITALNNDKNVVYGALNSATSHLRKTIANAAALPPSAAVHSQRLFMGATVAPIGSSAAVTGPDVALLPLIPTFGFGAPVTAQSSDRNIVYAKNSAIHSTTTESQTTASVATNTLNSTTFEFELVSAAHSSAQSQSNKNSSVDALTNESTNINAARTVEPVAAHSAVTVRDSPGSSSNSIAARQEL